MCDLTGPDTGTTPAPTMLTNGSAARPFCAVCAAMAETISNSGYFTKLDTEQKELRGKVGL